MPIHIEFKHDVRLAVAVIRGSVSAEDVRDAVVQFVAADARSYRKIIDIASPETRLEGTTSIEDIASIIMNRPATGPRGPLAFVVGAGLAADNAESYAKLTADGRPIKVFQTLPKAEKWLDENSPLPSSD